MISVFLSACAQSNGIDITSIQIRRTQQHPFFVDHKRVLATLDKNGWTIDEIELYPDTGDGCDSYVFDLKEKYVLVDCNGRWIVIDRTTGEINDEGWKWNEELPNGRLGRFSLDVESENYKFESDLSFRKADVYRFKDPK